MIKNKLLIATLSLAACSDPADVAPGLGERISAELRRNDHKSIDFAVASEGVWSRVCFFGPYNERSSEALGFEWHVGEHTDVLRSDGHTVIVFATGTEVVEYVAHSRGDGDFSELSGECFPRDEARFVKDPGSGHWKTAASTNAE